MKTTSTFYVSTDNLDVRVLPWSSQRRMESIELPALNYLWKKRPLEVTGEICGCWTTNASEYYMIAITLCLETKHSRTC